MLVIEWLVRVYVEKSRREKVLKQERYSKSKRLKKARVTVLMI